MDVSGDGALLFMKYIFCRLKITITKEQEIKIRSYNSIHFLEFHSISSSFHNPQTFEMGSRGDIN